MTTPKKPRSRQVAPPAPAQQPPSAVEQEPAKVELPPIRRIDLDPAEAAELRALHANRVLVVFQAASLRHMADGLVAVADQQIRDCAHRMAKTAGVDLSQESGGRWHIDAERGCIEEEPLPSPAPAAAKDHP